MKFKKKIVILLIAMLLYSNNVYAKYVYNFEENIINLTRDNVAPVCNITYSTEEWTNKNVVITITCNEEVQQVSGFELSEDKKTLKKEVSENEAGIIKIRDYSGNYTEIEYDVSNIDKEAPQIIGCEDGQTYTAPLSLDYTDNVEIKEIEVDKYSENLEINVNGIFYDSDKGFGIDRTNTTIKVEVAAHPENTKKYKYYINNQLYTTTADTEYIFTGLIKGTQYEIKVEAIDENGNIIQTAVVEEKTSYYETITSNKTQDRFDAIFCNLDSEVNSVRYAFWNAYDPENVIWYDSEIIDRNVSTTINAFVTENLQKYIMHVYLYDINGNTLDIVGFSVDFDSQYEEKDLSINIYELTQSGNYRIKVKDLAGNEIIYYIKVE